MGDTDEDIDAAALVDEYERIVSELQDEVATIRSELDAMEETGVADNHPEKHAEAEQKLAEITGQLKELKAAADQD